MSLTVFMFPNSKAETDTTHTSPDPEATIDSVEAQVPRKENASVIDITSLDFTAQEDIMDITNVDKNKRGFGAKFRAFASYHWDRAAESARRFPGNIGPFLKSNLGIIVFSVVYASITITCAQTVWKSKFNRNSHIMLFVLWALMCALLKDLPAGISFMAALTVCISFNIITPVQALAGFSNTGVFQVAVLFIVAEGIKQTGCLDFILQRILGSPKNKRVALVKLCIPVAVLSAFLNNTPIVAMMIPIVDSFCRRTGFSQSHFMIPLSYSTILGGTISYIGTSVNLVAYNLAKAKEPTLNMSNLFEIGIVGVPVCVAGLIYVVIFAPILLKDRLGQKRKKDIAGAQGVAERNYVAAVKVSTKSSLVGKSIKDASARELQHVGALNLFEIQRDGLVFQNPSQDTVLKSSDRLLFTGPKLSVRDLFSVRGLDADVEQVGDSKDSTLVEVVVAGRSQLVGKSAAQADLQGMYGAVIVAIQRGGERLSHDLAHLPLHAGDGLVLVCGKEFLKRHGRDPNFAAVIPFEEEDRIDTKRIDPFKMVAASLLALGMIIIPSLDNYVGYFTLTHTVLIAAYGMLLFRCIKADQMLSSLDGDVLLTISAAFGIGTALDQSGVAKAFADSILGIFSGSTLGLLFGIYIACVILNAVITNAACVALVFPIVYTALKGQVSTKTIVYILMMAGSADFSTPIGYQTNLMTQAPGGYKFLDYTKIGFPLQLICMVISVPMCYYVW
eukprot:CAMPEP_0196657280 /NCGR_PEP_ID=MMETSP1086-20130531/22551_1 /TAXON_ID=77921 /ORGANISM="Cyanoptyche  gloeocystis , Strain SAG4.97" /LENGTH=729 /DNA_ID=CAMNT_0041990343 /DNA_START=195 /DNA_END=2381 /DNA_ORIENTATION=-